MQKLKGAWSKLCAKTVNSALGVLSKLLNAAVEWGVIDGLPVKIKKLKVPVLPYPFYDFAQYAKVVAAAVQVSPEALAVVLLGGDAGLRRGEIASFEWRDIDFKGRALTVQRTVWNGQVTAPKGGRSRTIPMTPALSAALTAIRHLRGPRMLCTEEGDPVTEGSVNECMETVLRRAGIGRSRKVHILRHTFCSHLAMQSAPAKAIQELAGHTDLTTTMRYMHLAPGSLRAAVNLLEGRPSEPQAGNMQETATPKKPSTA